MMWKQSVWSSSIAARIAAKHLKEGGVLQLTGAAAVSFFFFDTLNNFQAVLVETPKITKCIEGEYS